MSKINGILLDYLPSLRSYCRPRDSESGGNLQYGVAAAAAAGCYHWLPAEAMPAPTKSLAVQAGEGENQSEGDVLHSLVQLY